MSAEEFAQELEEEVFEQMNANQPDLTKLWLWFAPTSAWDDFSGKEGEEVGNFIFETIDNWYKKNKKADL